MIPVYGWLSSWEAACHTRPIETSPETLARTYVETITRVAASGGDDEVLELVHPAAELRPDHHGRRAPRPRRRGGLDQGGPRGARVGARHPARRPGRRHDRRRDHPPARLAPAPGDRRLRHRLGRRVHGRPAPPRDGLPERRRPPRQGPRGAPVVDATGSDPVVACAIRLPTGQGPGSHRPPRARRRSRGRRRGQRSMPGSGPRRGPPRRTPRSGARCARPSSPTRAGSRGSDGTSNSGSPSIALASIATYPRPCRRMLWWWKSPCTSVVTPGVERRIELPRERYQLAAALALRLVEPGRDVVADPPEGRRRRAATGGRPARSRPSSPRRREAPRCRSRDRRAPSGGPGGPGRAAGGGRRRRRPRARERRPRGRTRRPPAGVIFRTASGPAGAT